MFRRKDDNHDRIQQTNIKRGITSHFARTLKVLQQRHLLSDVSEFIHSDDASNNLCNALEAVFLHGLKDSVAHKITAYVGLSAVTTDSTSGPNFWSVVAKFTHSDVIVQLQALSQINTNIGWCRAWIRLALNDGLMQSYLHSMIVDTKTLKYFYHSFAFLRDFEQPGILKNLLTGLMSLDFKLSYNASVLNSWNNTTLQIAGLLDSQSVPPPAISVSSTTDVSNKQIKEDSSKVTRKEEPVLISSSGVENLPVFAGVGNVVDHPSSAADVSLLSVSEGSTCSQVSCPDPGPSSTEHFTTLVKKSLPNSPASGNTEGPAFLAADSSPQDCKGGLWSSSFGQDIQAAILSRASPEIGEHVFGRATGSIVISDDTASLADSLTRPRSRRVDEDELKHYSPKDLSLFPKQEPAQAITVGRESTASSDDSFHFQNHPDEAASKGGDLSQTLADSDSVPREINYEEICANPSGKNYEEIYAHLPALRLDSMERDAILHKVLEEFDKQADKEREVRDARQAESHIDDAGATTWVSNDIATHLKAGHNEMSHYVIGQGQNAAHAPSENHTTLEASIYNTLNESADELSMSGHFGNSLSGMSGWSSDIESRKGHRAKQGHESDKGRAESFASLLRTYVPDISGRSPIVTLDQVIGSLPVTEFEDGLKSEGSSSNTKSDVAQHQDTCLEGFEVVQCADTSNFGPVNSSSRMILLFEIAREHGLSHQNFTCRGCSRPIGIIYGKPRLCEFDGGLYCYECHENNESYIPSYIVFNWDFRKRKVSKENFKFLQEFEDQALYDVELLNPKLYVHVPELDELKTLRQQLCYLKSYLFTCSQKVAGSLRQKVWPREHLYDKRDLYSVGDFLQVQSGTLQKLVKELVKFGSSHVYECALCSQKGFVCEICRNPKVIYPFEVETTLRCKTCKAVYHKTCMTESLPCPKCERWGRRVSKSSIVEDHPEDYGMSPSDKL
ncbi:unnamed protein product [Lymnaea stagnalis]|uniref:RUN domain-containing protein n=1 Tax=Lymnaea stagnalis TaxID=6523 RepID=A0AAV2HQR9_LYMST